MITKDNFIDAKYIDNERVNIEVLLKDGEKVIPHIIEHKPGHPSFEALMKLTSIEEIHDNTAAYIKDTRKSFKNMVYTIAKADGLLKPKTILKTKTDTVTKEIEIEIDKPISDILDTIFLEDMRHDDEKHKEEIFKCKLKAFEFHFVKNSKNRELKAKLRKAETYLDIVCIVCEFVKETYV